MRDDVGSAELFSTKTVYALKHGVTRSALGSTKACMDPRRTCPLRRCLLTSVATTVLVAAVLASSAVLWAGITYVRGPPAQSSGRGDGGARKLDLFYALNLDYSQRTVIHYHHIVSVGPDCVGGAFGGLRSHKRRASARRVATCVACNELRFTPTRAPACARSAQHTISRLWAAESIGVFVVQLHTGSSLTDTVVRAVPCARTGLRSTGPCSVMHRVPFT